MKKTKAVLPILLGLTITTILVSCSTYQRPGHCGYVLTNPPIELPEKPRPVKPPFLKGMEPEGTFEKPGMEETIARLIEEGKMKTGEEVPAAETAEKEAATEPATEEVLQTEEIPAETIAPAQPVMTESEMELTTVREEEKKTEEEAAADPIPEATDTGEEAEEEPPAETVPDTEAPAAEGAQTEPETEEEYPPEEPIMEECAEDTSLPGTVPPLEEVKVMEEPEEEAPAEKTERKDPEWLTDLSSTEDSAFFRGSCRRYSKMMSGMMLAETDAIGQAKRWMQDTAIREAEVLSGLEPSEPGAALIFVPEKLVTARESTWSSDTSEIFVLLKVSRASMLDWMGAAGDRILEDNFTGPETLAAKKQELREVLDLRISERQ